MDPVTKALWYVESHFAGALTLEDVASAAGVSRFHLARAFGLATGHPIMRYARARRLTEGARALAGGAPDILAVALDAGYGSHEAFTRAFRDQFGVTPETVRARRDLAPLDLMEPIKMSATDFVQLDTPRFESLSPLLVAGLAERYNGESVAGIPALWQRLGPYKGRVPGQVGEFFYGVCWNSDEAGNFDYLCGVEVGDFSRLPVEFGRVRIPALTYAVFTHREHVSSIRRAWNTIMGQWLPQSGRQMADAPEFERYGPSFDAEKGSGGVEIWIPLRN